MALREYRSQTWSLSRERENNNVLIFPIWKGTKKFGNLETLSIFHVGPGRLSP